MAGGAYTALTGLQARLAQLDRLAADLANVGTAGYKGERGTTATAERLDFAGVLRSAIDTTPSVGHTDFRRGTLEPTGRDLDFAIEGRGFFVVETPAGPRFTRNGHFDRLADGSLVTTDGFAVLGEDGPIRLPDGPVTVEPDGSLSGATGTIGRLQVVDFNDNEGLIREGTARFAAPDGVVPAPVEAAVVRGGSLEGSNVSLVERMVELTAVTRSFEALQRGVRTLMVDIDGRAISELGRR